MKFKQGKKAALEIQFNWIFVMIAGALILSFFVNVAIKQKQLSEQKLASEVINKLELVLSGASVSPETTLPLDIPDFGFTFSCDVETCTDYACSSELSVDLEKSPAVSYNVRPVFSPQVVEGSRMTTWTVEWKVPYAVTNLLLVISPEVRYIIVKPRDDTLATFAEELYNELPDKKTDEKTGGYVRLLTKELVDRSGLNNLRDEGHYRVRFVVFDDGSVPLASFAKRKADVVRITPDGGAEDINGRGLVSYGQEESFYYGRALLLASIFADSYESYGCNMQKALHTLREVSKVYKGKAEKLHEHFRSSGFINVCNKAVLYSSGKAQAAFQQMNVDGVDHTNIKERITGASQELEAYNEELLLASCPALY